MQTDHKCLEGKLCRSCKCMAYLHNNYNIVNLTQDINCDQFKRQLKIFLSELLLATAHRDCLFAP